MQYNLSLKDSKMMTILFKSKNSNEVFSKGAPEILLSKCKFIITHTGNCGIWTVLYRNNSDGVHQYRNNIWT